MDTYKVKILYILNPHYIWVRAIGLNVYDQVGLYGVVPNTCSINPVEGFNTYISKTWPPAACETIKKVLKSAAAVYFSPIHDDSRTSVFSTNNHKYGEFFILQQDGVIRRLSSLLDECLFINYDEKIFRSWLYNHHMEDMLNDQTKYKIVNYLEDYIQNESIEAEEVEYLELSPNDNDRINSLLAMESKLCQVNHALNPENHHTAKGSFDSSYDDEIEVSPETVSEIKSSLIKRRLMKNSKLKNWKNSNKNLLKHEKQIHEGSSQNGNSTDELVNDNFINLIGNMALNKNKIFELKQKAVESLNKDVSEDGTSTTQDQVMLSCNIDTSERYVSFGPAGLSTLERVVKKKKNYNKLEQEVSNVNQTPAKVGRKESVLENYSYNEINKLHRNNTNNIKQISVNNEKPNLDISYKEESCDKSYDFNSDDEKKMAELEKKLLLTKKPHQKSPKKSEIPVKNANPFKNVDSGITPFINEFANPIIMVHSKMGIKIRPILKLSDVCFGPAITSGLTHMSVTHPMVLQTVSWFSILRGYSIILIGHPGSGKTLGFTPAVCQLVMDTTKDFASGPVTIIVCATTKSVFEVTKQCKAFYKTNVVSSYTGADEKDVIVQLLNGCDILVSTPCALARLLRNDEFGVDLRRLTVFVMDDGERLAKVYTDELKYFLLKIKEMLKNRLDKDRKVQYVVTSRSWSDSFETLAKFAPNSVVCIGAHHECILYSKVPTSISFISTEKKLNIALDFVNDNNDSGRKVFVCCNDEEIFTLVEKFKALKCCTIFHADSKTELEVLYNIKKNWSLCNDQYGPILICCDDNLELLNIDDASYLFHYSMPQSFTDFSKRFRVLNNNYPSIFVENKSKLKIHILIDQNNTKQLPKVINFVKRCVSVIPKEVNTITEDSILQKDLARASNYVPICDNLLSLGECPDPFNCNERHSLFKKFDNPPNWVPKAGTITFKIIYYNSPVTYSAKLLTSTFNGETTKYPQNYNAIALKLCMFYSKEANKRPLGVPKLGDFATVLTESNEYKRSQVVRFLNTDGDDKPNIILVKLLDEEKWITTRATYLYHLPDNLRSIPSNVIKVRLVNIHPKDRDITFSDITKQHLEKLDGEDIYMRGTVVLTIGNCVFVDDVDACQGLESVGNTVVRYTVKNELLSHALINPQHIVKIRQLVEKSDMPVLQIPEEKKIVPVQTLVEPRWAHFYEDLTLVYFATAVNPDKFFVRLEKFDDCLEDLTNDIQKYIENSKPAPESTIKEGKFVLARFPDDNKFHRARIAEITDDVKTKCFFVDHGDWRYVNMTDIVPIIDKFVTKLPFQAIECRLVGIRPVNNEWSDFATNYFCDQCFHGDSLESKQLFVKYITKETSSCTGGHKYGVIMIDTMGDSDVIINQCLIDCNFAQLLENEKQHLEPIEQIKKADVDSVDDDISETAECVNMPLSDYSDFDFACDENYARDLMTNLMDTNLNSLFSQLTAGEDKENSISKLSDYVIMDNFDTQSSSVASSDYDESYESFLKPKLLWRQNKEYISIKIELVGIETYDVKISKRTLKFCTTIDDKKYGFHLNLYGGVKPDLSKHASKGQYISIKLAKLVKSKWCTLTQSDTKWMKQDPDSLDATSDDESDSEQVKNYDNYVKGIHQESDEDSDEDIVDDFNYVRRNYIP